MNTIKLNKRIFLTLSVLAFLLILVGVATFTINNYLKIPSIIKDNPNNNSKVYSNDTEGFSFEYPNDYKIKETIQEGHTLLYLKKDEMLDKQGYALLKGTNISITYKKNVPLSDDYVKEENKYIIEDIKDTQIQKKLINNMEVLEFIYGTNYPLKFSGVSSVYFKNKNDILELSLMLGVDSTKAEYEEYQKQFNTMVNSVKFIK